VLELLGKGSNLRQALLESSIELSGCLFLLLQLLQQLLMLFGLLTGQLLVQLNLLLSVNDIGLLVK
jgi:hypothetical protein